MGAPCHTYIFSSLSALKEERGGVRRPMLTNTTPSPQHFPHLVGARELFPFGAGVKMHLRLTAARVRV